MANVYSNLESHNENYVKFARGDGDPYQEDLDEDNKTVESLNQEYLIYKGSLPASNLSKRQRKIKCEELLRKAVEEGIIRVDWNRPGYYIKPNRELVVEEGKIVICSVQREKEIRERMWPGP